MEERENVYRQRAKDRARREQDKSLPEETRQRPRRKKVPLAATVPVVPRSTTSFSLKMAHVRARLEKEKSDLKRQTQEELARRTRQQAMSKTISVVMRRMDSQQTRRARRPTAAEARQTARESQEIYHVCLQENKQKLEQVRDVMGQQCGRKGCRLCRACLLRVLAGGYDSTKLSAD